MTRKTLTLIAALLMTLTVFVHIFPGGAEVHLPLQAAPIPEGLKAISSVIWHAVTVMLIVIAGGTFWLWRHPNPALETALAAIQIGFTGLFLFYGLTRLGEISSMPQWVIFLAVPLLTRFGQRGR